MHFLSQLEQDALQLTDIQFLMDELHEKHQEQKMRLHHAMSLDYPRKIKFPRVKPLQIRYFKDLNSSQKTALLEQENYKVESVDTLYKDWLRRYRNMYMKLFKPSRLVLFTLILAYGFATIKCLYFGESDILLNLTYCLLIGVSTLGLTSLFWYPVCSWMWHAASRERPPVVGQRA